MLRGDGPFNTWCCWCDRPFLARNKADICCSVACNQQLSSDLQDKEGRLRSLDERVQVLNEKAGRAYLRTEVQIRKLKSLGAQWRFATEAERNLIEYQERSIAKVLSKLNIRLHRTDRKARSPWLNLISLEGEVAELRKIVGVRTSTND